MISKQAFFYLRYSAARSQIGIHILKRECISSSCFQLERAEVVAPELARLLPLIAAQADPESASTQVRPSFEAWACWNLGGVAFRSSAAMFRNEKGKHFSAAEPIAAWIRLLMCAF